MRSTWWIGMVAAALLAGCASDDDGGGGVDTGGGEDAGDAVDPEDSGDAMGETDGDSAGGEDGEDGDGSAQEPETVAAVPGARCELSERIGEIAITGDGGGLYAIASIYDRPHPWYGDWKLQSDDCAFHEFSPQGACAPCAGGEMCATDGTCRPAPLLVEVSRFALFGDSGAQELVTGAPSKQPQGVVTLADAAFAVEVTWGSHTVTLAETEVPGALAGLQGVFAGDYDAPGDIDITWTPQPEGGTVHTNIPINHHAAGPTFTDCAVPASSGAMHVPEEMVTPLAVITGLEFQGIDHARFAAAQTSAGCVDIVLSTHFYLDLQSQ